MVVKHNMKGIATKGSEIFGSFGEIGTSKTYSYFRGLLTEIRIRFDNGPTGLMHGKFEDEVDFNKTFEHDTYRVDALHNMAVIDKMAQSHA